MKPKLLASYVLFPCTGTKEDGGRRRTYTRMLNTRTWPTIRAQPANCKRVLSLSSLSFYRCALRLLGNRADAEDPVQEALWAAHNHLHQSSGHSQISPWLPP